jgi:cellulose synthase/poly-beta-1,6-N-acetylglucosamine synthase-like glycosyltransferase
VTSLVALLLAPFAVLTSFFTAEVLAGLRRIRATAAHIEPATAVIVVPAHDEAAVIGATLGSLGEALGDRMRVLVVADNCSDATADQARKSGVDVIERRDPERPGKGHALAYAAEHLAADPPQVLVVLDADCMTDAASLRALVDGAARSNRPCQAVNLLRPDRNASPMIQLSTFAFVLKNLVRQRGLQRLAARVHLTGTGMAMRFATFRASAGVRSSIVEDLALGLELAETGRAPTLVADAFVWSGASSEGGTLIQRRRWEGGFLATALRHGPTAFARALRQADLRGLLAALDLMVPPLALFAILNVAALAIAVLLTAVSGAAGWPVGVQLVLLGTALMAVFLAWVREGRRYVSLGVLARIPFYVLWKVPLYLGLARRGAPAEWLRTGR